MSHNQGSSSRRPGSSGGSSRASQQRPLKAVHDFGQHAAVASASSPQSAAPATSSSVPAGSDWNSSAGVGKKWQSPSSSPFPFRLSSSPDPSSRSRSPASPGGPNSAKNCSSKRRSPGGSPVTIVRQSPQHVLLSTTATERELETAASPSHMGAVDLGFAVGSGAWRIGRPSSVDVMEGGGGGDAAVAAFPVMIAGSPGAFAWLPRANSRASVGSVSSELEGLVLDSAATAAMPSLDGRRPPVVHLVTRRDSTPTLAGTPHAVSPGSGRVTISPSHSTASGGAGVAYFTPSPQPQLSRRGSSDYYDSPPLTSASSVPTIAIVRLMSGSPRSFDCIPPPEGATRIQTCSVAQKVPDNTGQTGLGDASQAGPDRSKVNITFSQSTVFQQCVPAGQS